MVLCRCRIIKRNTFLCKTVDYLFENITSVERACRTVWKLTMVTLQANSFLEIGRHPTVYRQVVGIIKQLCSQPALLCLLGPLPNQNHSVQALLHNLEQQANIMINRIGGYIPGGFASYFYSLILGPWHFLTSHCSSYKFFEN